MPSKGLINELGLQRLVLMLALRYENLNDVVRQLQSYGYMGIERHHVRWFLNSLSPSDWQGLVRKDWARLTEPIVDFRGEATIIYERLRPKALEALDSVDLNAARDLIKEMCETWDDLKDAGDEGDARAELTYRARMDTQLRALRAMMYQGNLNAVKTFFSELGQWFDRNARLQGLIAPANTIYNINFKQDFDEFKNSVLDTVCEDCMLKLSEKARIQRQDSQSEIDLTRKLCVERHKQLHPGTDEEEYTDVTPERGADLKEGAGDEEEDTG